MHFDNFKHTGSSISQTKKLFDLNCQKNSHYLNLTLISEAKQNKNAKIMHYCNLETSSKKVNKMYQTCFLTNTLYSNSKL